MVASLKSVTSPTLSVDIINSAVKSHKGINMIWVLVEGDDDVNLYGGFFDKQTSYVLKANAIENKREKSCKQYVLNIVSEFLKYEKLHVIGIVDADYDRYSYNTTYPQNVFVTDHRDIEMTMLACKNTHDRLNQWCNELLQKLTDDVLPKAKIMGFLRIYNEVKDLGFTFSDFFKISMLWDNKTHQFMENWENVVYDSFVNRINHSGGKILRKDINTFIINHNLNSESSYDVCRGHDVIDILSNVLIKQQYCKRNLVNELFKYFEKDDFLQTNFGNSIFLWATNECLSCL